MTPISKLRTFPAHQPRNAPVARAPRPAVSRARDAFGAPEPTGSRAKQLGDPTTGPVESTRPSSVDEAAIPPRLRSDALRVRNTTTPEHVTINGVGIDVYGASPDELETIRTTLGRLPASHLRTIPQVVVADRIGHGNNPRGGAWVDEAAIRRYEEGGGARNAAAYRALGWVNTPRLELTHESLGRASVRRTHLSPTILHETGHAVDARYHLSRDLSAESLGGIDYNGPGGRGPGELGSVHERFADGYMRYYLGSLRSDPVAYPTISSAIDSVPAE
jgi:hypothetical protein